MRKINIALIYPIILGIPSLFLIVCKGAFESSSQLTMLGSKVNWMNMFFRQTCQFSFIAVIHYCINKEIMNRFNIPTIFCNLFFYGLYLEIFGFSIYDFENCRVNMQIALPSFLTAFVWKNHNHNNTFTSPLYRIPSPPLPSTNARMTTDTIYSCPYFWIPAFILIGLWFVLKLYLVYRYWPDIILSTKRNNNSTIKCSQGTDSKSIIINELYNKEPGIFWKLDNKSKNTIDKTNSILLLVYLILAIIYVFTLIHTFLIPSDTKLSKFSILPYFETIFLTFTHFENKLTKDTKANLVNNIRSYLPPGRRWLDNRKNIVYPAVHGDMKAFCAYNKDNEDCKNFIPPEKPKLIKDPKDMPNVVFFVYESLTPNYKLITEDYVVEHASLDDNDPRKLITNKTYYNTEVFNNFAKYQKYAITFGGMSSFGLPTLSGCHSILSGLTPSQTYLNIIAGSLVHSDDFPSEMKSLGYRSIYISSTFFHFDGFKYWVWRKPAEEEAKQRLGCINGFGDLLNDTSYTDLIPKDKMPKLRQCSEKEINDLAKKLRTMHLDFPPWFDYAFDYFPTKENSPLLGIDPNSIPYAKVLTSDRITAIELIYHWKQQRAFLNRTNQHKPIFAAILTAESHLPYNGYDKQQFYDQELDDKTIFLSDEVKNLKFVLVNKYSDKYEIGKVLDWLKENDPNTIFAITGDHGTRDIPLRESNSQIYEDHEDIVFSSDCVHHATGVDSFYVTSGMLGYLGDNEIVKEAMGLNELSGKTVKIPSDHNDLIYTIEDILNRLNGTTMQPTHRRNRNLIDLSLNISRSLQSGNQTVSDIYKSLDASGWRSYSTTALMSEYREGSKLLRAHPGDIRGSHYYEHVSYPTCIRNITKDKKEMKLGTKESKNMFYKMFKVMQSETYLTYNNRIYNYGFRNQTCIDEGECEFKEPYKINHKSHDLYFLGTLILIPTVIMVVLSSIVEIISIAFYSNYMKQSDETALYSDEAINNQDETYPIEDMLLNKNENEI